MEIIPLAARQWGFKSLPGHHGSRNTSTAEFLAEVSPTITVISAGANNSYGHLSQEALSRLGTEMALDMICVTGESGTIDLITHGKTVELFAENKLPVNRPSSAAVRNLQKGPCYTH